MTNISVIFYFENKLKSLLNWALESFMAAQNAGFLILEYLYTSQFSRINAPEPTFSLLDSWFWSEQSFNNFQIEFPNIKCLE